LRCTREAKFGIIGQGAMVAARKRLHNNDLNIFSIT
jgi:hypothetical protein